MNSTRLLFWTAVVALGLMACGPSRAETDFDTPVTNMAAELGLRIDTALILEEAEAALAHEVATVTSFAAERSAGGPHDYYSEGRYWWPNPDDPDGPYIRRDGISFTGLFTDHRRALGDLGDDMSALTVAYLGTGDERYAEKARAHALAWFVDTATVMNPRLTYAQAIKGITDGRGIGIIDTKSLLYVSRALALLAEEDIFSAEELAAVRRWFGAYGDWLVTSDHGHDERDNGNNHSTWWGAQLAAYARLAQRDDLLDTARLQFRRQLDLQMDSIGVFTDEVGRTRPFHYTEYNLDGMTTLAHVASGPGHDLWRYEASNGTLRKAVDWYVDYFGRLHEWPYPAELEPAPAFEPADYLYLAAVGYGEPAYAKTFLTLHDRYGDDAGHHGAHDAHLAVLTWPGIND